MGVHTPDYFSALRGVRLGQGRQPVIPPPGPLRPPLTIPARSGEKGLSSLSGRWAVYRGESGGPSVAGSLALSIPLWNTLYGHNGFASKFVFGSGAMADVAYVKFDGKVYGLLSMEILKQLIKQGKIKADSPIRREENGEWFRAGQVKGLQECFESVDANSIEHIPAQENDPIRVKIVDIKIPFVSMVEFMILWSLAAIPATIILSLLGLALFGIALVLIPLIHAFLPMLLPG